MGLKIYHNASQRITQGNKQYQLSIRLYLQLCEQSKQTFIKMWPSSYQKREFCGTMLPKETAETWKWLALWPLELTYNMRKCYPKKPLEPENG